MKEMDFKFLEPLDKSSQKRKADDLEKEEQNLDSEATSSSKPILEPRKKRTPAALAEYSVGSEEDESESGSVTSPLADKIKGNYSACHWEYEDLEYLNISYDKTPEPFEKFVKEVKDGFLKRKGFCPEHNEMASTFKKQFEENLTFSYDLSNLRDIRYTSIDYREDELKKVNQEMEENMKKMWKSSEKMQSDKRFFRGLDSPMKGFMKSHLYEMVLAVRDFAVETTQLIKKILFSGPEPALEPKEKEKAKEQERGKHHRRGHRVTHRGGRGGYLFNPKWTVKAPENFFQNYCEVFGRMFFLKKGELKQACFTFQEKTVRNTPDLVYHFFSATSKEELLFLTEVKRTSVNEGVTDIKEIAGSNVLGQLGAELLGQSINSVFYPNCLGILCMETKLIFVFLKISLEHSIEIHKGNKGSPDDPGKILYTQPFDMLKADDRVKMTEFMFWLGFLQDSAKYKFF